MKILLIRLYFTYISVQDLCTWDLCPKVRYGVVSSGSLSCTRLAPGIVMDRREKCNIPRAVRKELSICHAQTLLYTWVPPQLRKKFVSELINTML